MDMQLMEHMEKLENLFSTRMERYEDRLDKAKAEAAPTPQDITSLSREFSDFKSLVWQLFSNLKSQIELLSLGLDRHETAMRKKVLLLHGVTEKPNEKVFDVAHNILSTKLKLPEITLDHLNVCHRLGSSKDKIRPILVRFHDMEQRDLVWDNKTELKGSVITMSEFLTKARHKVFVAARKHFGIKQCWTVEGKITIILPDKSKQKIESQSELNSLISKFPTASTESDAINQGPSSPKSTASKTANAPRRTRRRN